MDKTEELKAAVAAQPFPVDLGQCPKVDFHFNKIAIEYPFMPHWTVKAKGKTFYVYDFISEVGFTTVNKPEGNTRGLLRFRNGHLTIDEAGVARFANR